MRAIAIALDDALERGWHDAFDDARGATGAPDEEADVAHGVADDPSIAGAADAFVLGILILHGRLIYLQMTIGEHVALDVFDDEGAGVVRHTGPAAKSLPRDRHSQPLIPLCSIR